MNAFYDFICFNSTTRSKSFATRFGSTLKHISSRTPANSRARSSSYQTTFIGRQDSHGTFKGENSGFSYGDVFRFFIFYFFFLLIVQDVTGERHMRSIVPIPELTRISIIYSKPGSITIWFKK